MVHMISVESIYGTSFYVIAVDRNYVTFAGSSPQDKESAKALYQAICPVSYSPSALEVPGVEQRVRTAPPIGVEIVPMNKIGPKAELFEMKAKEFVLTAEKRKNQEAVRKLQSFDRNKEDAQALLYKRRQERILKESILQPTRAKDEFVEFECQDLEQEEESVLEAQAAMSDIEKFESKLNR